MIIYIRHANDESDSDEKHDPELTSDAKEEIRAKVAKLVSRYGIPLSIEYSPFLRTRQTAEIMLDELRTRHLSSSHEVEMIVNSDLSRYFTESEKKQPSVHDSTKDWRIPIYEQKEQFESRVTRHVAETIRNEKIYSTKRVHWVITHTLVIKRVAKIHRQEIDDHLPFLYSFTIAYKQ